MNKLVFVSALFNFLIVSVSYASIPVSEFNDEQTIIFDSYFDQIYDEIDSTYDSEEMISDLAFKQTENAISNAIKYHSSFNVIENECIQPYIPVEFKNKGQGDRYLIFSKYYQVCINSYLGLVLNDSADAINQFHDYHDQVSKSLSINSEED